MPSSSLTISKVLLNLSCLYSSMYKLTSSCLDGYFASIHNIKCLILYLFVNLNSWVHFYLLRIEKDSFLHIRIIYSWSSHHLAQLGTVFISSFPILRLHSLISEISNLLIKALLSFFLQLLIPRSASRSSICEKQRIKSLIH